MPNNWFPFEAEYYGLWAIEEAAANALISRAETLNLQLHLEQHAAAPGGSRGMRSEDFAATEDGIAVIDIHGVLTKQTSSFSGGASTVRARRQIRAAANNRQIEAILLHIDSPGGRVSGTTDLADDIAAIAKSKPVWAYVEDMAASGGYWLASQATTVHANRMAMIGSIGAFMVVYDFSKAAADKGIVTHVIRFGALKGAGTPGTAITDEQIATWQKSINEVGNDFVASIARGRGLEKTAVSVMADGGIHLASAALSMRLIDRISTIDETMAMLRQEISHQRRTSNMSAQNPSSVINTQIVGSDGAPLQAQPTQAAAPASPQAATLDDLESSLPGASAEFIVGQMKAKATIADAMKAYTAHLSAENAQLRAARAEQGQVAATQVNSTAPVESFVRADGDGLRAVPLHGSQPGSRFQPMINDALSGSIKGGASPDQFTALVEQYRVINPNATYRAACHHVAKSNPDLHKSFVAACPPAPESRE